MNSSGAMYRGVPVFLPIFSPCRMCWEHPKSATRTCSTLASYANRLCAACRWVQCSHASAPDVCMHRACKGCMVTLHVQQSTWCIGGIHPINQRLEKQVRSADVQMYRAPPAMHLAVSALVCTWSSTDTMGLRGSSGAQAAPQPKLSKLCSPQSLETRC